MLVFPNLSLASATFFDKKNFYRPPTMASTRVNTIFRIAYLVFLKIIKTRMSAKMHFTIKLNLVN